MAAHYVMESNPKAVEGSDWDLSGLKDTVSSIETKPGVLFLSIRRSVCASHLLDVSMGTLQFLIWLSSESDTSIWRGSRGIHTLSSS